MSATTTIDPQRSELQTTITDIHTHTTIFKLTSLPFANPSSSSSSSSPFSPTSTSHEITYPIIMVTPPKRSSSSSNSNISINDPKPSTWNSQHEKRLREHVRNGEDARSIVILMETEFEVLNNGKLGEGWVRKKVEELTAAAE